MRHPALSSGADDVVRFAAWQSRLYPVCAVPTTTLFARQRIVDVENLRFPRKNPEAHRELIARLEGHQEKLQQFRNWFMKSRALPEHVNATRFYELQRPVQALRSTKAMRKFLSGLLGEICFQFRRFERVGTPEGQATSAAA